MFETEAKEYAERTKIKKELDVLSIVHDWGRESLTQEERHLWEGVRDRQVAREQGFKDGAEFGYNKANERHSPEEHIDKDKVVLGIIKLCNKTRYSLVQWNGEWWYEYGSFNAEVRLIAWYNIPELPKESE